MGVTNGVFVDGVPSEFAFCGVLVIETFLII